MIISLSTTTICPLFESHQNQVPKPRRVLRERDVDGNTDEKCRDGGGIPLVSRAFPTHIVRKFRPQCLKIYLEEPTPLLPTYASPQWLCWFLLVLARILLQLGTLKRWWLMTSAKSAALSDLRRRWERRQAWSELLKHDIRRIRSTRSSQLLDTQKDNEVYIYGSHHRTCVQ